MFVGDTTFCIDVEKVEKMPSTSELLKIYITKDLMALWVLPETACQILISNKMSGMVVSNLRHNLIYTPKAYLGKLEEGKSWG